MLSFLCFLAFQAVGGMSGLRGLSLIQKVCRGGSDEITMLYIIVITINAIIGWVVALLYGHVRRGTFS